MKTSLFTGIAALATLAAAAAAIAQPGRSGTATYWMSAETTSGFAASAAGGQPSRGSIIGALMSGRAGPGANNPAYVRSLVLQLGSPGRPSGPPAAEHLPPGGLGAGPSLPLLSPEPTRAPAPQPYPTPGQGDGGMQGRILIYWGCGERARPGQPFEIDLSRMARGQMPPAMAQLPYRPMTPPSAGTSGTYGEWPNQRSRTPIPAQGSLVGDHVVRGNYSPEIRFALAPGQDFLPPVLLTSNSPGPSGAVPVAWQPVAGARAYFAMATGATSDNTIILWSSSEIQFSQMGAFDYLSPEEIVRLLQQRVLLGPQTNQCTVPAEVASRVQAASLMVAAFGPEANFSHPARPARAPRGWAPDWTVKLRTRSAYTGLLGQDLEAMMRGQGREQQEERPRRRRSLRDRILGQ